jgi:hypothetical protein
MRSFSEPANRFVCVRSQSQIVSSFLAYTYLVAFPISEPYPASRIGSLVFEHVRFGKLLTLEQSINHDGRFSKSLRQATIETIDEGNAKSVDQS